MLKEFLHERPSAQSEWVYFLGLCMLDVLIVRLFASEMTNDELIYDFYSGGFTYNRVCLCFLAIFVTKILQISLLVAQLRSFIRFTDPHTSLLGALRIKTLIKDLVVVVAILMGASVFITMATADYYH